MRRAQHWSSMNESTFVAGIWLLYAIYRIFGRWPFRLCMAPVVAIYWILRPGLRAASLQYLQRLQQATGVLGDVPGAISSLRHVGRFGDTLLDKLLAAAGHFPQEKLRVIDNDDISGMADSKQGGVIVTAHIGCLELCQSLAEKRPAFRLNVLVHTRHAEKFNRLLKRLSPHQTVELLQVSEVGPATAVMLAQRIAAGEFVAIAGDRVPIKAGRTGAVDFLGHAAHFPTGPYVLASLLQCPLYFLGCIRKGSGYEIHFERLATQLVLPRRNRDAALTACVQHYVERITELLRRSPYDWFNFFPFWEQPYAR